MSSVNAVSNSSTSESSTTSRLPSKTMTQTDFLKVLVAQYSNQIPTDSQSSTEFYKNMMDLSNYQAIQDVSTKMSAQSAMQMVGQYVTAKDDEGNKTTGTITASSFDGTDWYYTINGDEYKPTQVTKITPPPVTTTDTSDSSSQ